MYVYGLDTAVLIKVNGVAFVDSVSVVATLFNFASAPISPACSSGTSSGLFPRSTYSLPILSSMPCSSLYITSSVLITPDVTLTREYFPINGSTMVLKTYALFAFAKLKSASYTSFVLILIALHCFFSGLGRYFTISSNKV